MNKEIKTKESCYQIIYSLITRRRPLPEIQSSLSGSPYSIEDLCSHNSNKCTFLELSIMNSRWDCAEYFILNGPSLIDHKARIFCEFIIPLENDKFELFMKLYEENNPDGFFQCIQFTESALAAAQYGKLQLLKAILNTYSQYFPEKITESFVRQLMTLALMSYGTDLTDTRNTNILQFLLPYLTKGNSLLDEALLESQLKDLILNGKKLFLSEDLKPFLFCEDHPINFLHNNGELLKALLYQADQSIFSSLSAKPKVIQASNWVFRDILEEALGDRYLYTGCPKNGCRDDHDLRNQDAQGHGLSLRKAIFLFLLNAKQKNPEEGQEEAENEDRFFYDRDFSYSLIESFTSAGFFELSWLEEPEVHDAISQSNWLIRQHFLERGWDHKKGKIPWVIGYRIPEDFRDQISIFYLIEYLKSSHQSSLCPMNWSLNQEFEGYNEQKLFSQFKKDLGSDFKHELIAAWIAGKEAIFKWQTIIADWSADAAQGNTDINCHIKNSILNELLSVSERNEGLSLFVLIQTLSELPELIDMIEAGELEKDSLEKDCMEFWLSKKQGPEQRRILDPYVQMCVECVDFMFTSLAFFLDISEPRENREFIIKFMTSIQDGTLNQDIKSRITKDSEAIRLIKKFDR